MNKIGEKKLSVNFKNPNTDKSKMEEIAIIRNF